MGNEMIYPAKTVKKIGFVGAGKVGCSFGRYITERSHGAYAISGYFSRDPASAYAAAAFAGGRAFETIRELAMECDLILLTVPDGQIPGVWEQLRNALPDGRAGSGRVLYICHCSGSLNSHVFGEGPPGAAGVAFGSIHPLLAVHDRETAYQKFDGAYFTIEGDEAFKSFAGELLVTLGNPFSSIDSERKTLYHAASVMVSNLVCALTRTGMEVFKACGLEGEFAESAWRSLFLGNAENIAALGPVRALTGPVERGDAATVARHLEALTGDIRKIYLLLSRTLVDAAREKNPDRDYSELVALVGKRQERFPGGQKTAIERNDSMTTINKDKVLIKDIAEMRAHVTNAQARGERIGLVPTMGALHEGHLSLVWRAAGENDLTIVSIFINPIQFDDSNDLATYPSTLTSDSEAAFAAGADIVFAPSAGQMYPEGFSTFVDMTGISERFCGAARPSYFRGVLTVVAKLFGICQPGKAYFGEKDAQQLAVVKKMVAELCMNVDIVGCPTVREEDGLAMSSRNARLSEYERESARCLYRALTEAKACFESGEKDPKKIAAVMRGVIENEPFAIIEYAKVVNPNTFDTPPFACEGNLVLLAVYFGDVRLIDNIRL